MATVMGAATIEHGSPISLYLDLEPGRIADLEVVSRAALAWVAALKEAAYVLDPSLEIRIELASGTPGSLSLNSIIKKIHEAEDSPVTWGALEARFLTKRINHSEAYSTADACTNMAESFFSRIRRAEIGIHHHIAGPYIAAYASEMAWREDNRRVSNGEQFLAATAAALAHPVSRVWKGYWQRAAA